MKFGHDFFQFLRIIMKIIKIIVTRLGDTDDQEEFRKNGFSGDDHPPE